MVKYVPKYSKGTLKKKDQQRTYEMVLMRCFCVIFYSDFLYKTICYGYSFELH